ncbi:MAG: ABC transporter substrate-binding protein [Clostridia bacterium]|nr:ABC transporter substrate-binding protein [Clostridia bacterium]
MKKTAALILILSLIFTVFCSCDDEKTPSIDPAIVSNLDNTKEGILKLAYSKADMLDPFTATMTANIQILSLVYDGLYKLDKNYEPIPVIAKSAIVSENAVNVTLDSVVFSDGSAVTAQDIIYSFDRAKFSPTYNEKLKNFKGANMSASNMIIFTLEKSDPYAVSCLTFPIVKNGSSGNLPVGSGRYIPEISGETTYLVVNKNKSGFNPAIKTIMLVPVRDSSSVESSLEIGNTGFYYNDLSNGVYSRINAHTVEMGINNFVYLAFNSESEYFSNSMLRQAVGYAVNRKEIVATAFQGHARETYSPFNPDWYALAAKDLYLSVDIQKALGLITESGINISEKEISLLVNKENQFKLETARFIRDYLVQLGFSVNLKEYETQYYKEALELGSYDMYIGEVRFSPNMDLSSMLGSGNIAFGIDQTGASCARYAQLLSGGCELMDFINTFNEDLPFIPLCYRNAAVSYTNSMQGGFNCCDGDVFYDIETWSFR